MLLAAAFWMVTRDTFQDVHELQVDGYSIAWQRRLDADDTSWCELRDPKGRVVVRLEGYFCAPLGLHEIVDDAVIDVDGDGKDEIVLQTWSGGVHGGVTYQIWALGTRPRCLLAWDKNNISDRCDFELEDIDGDGKPEVLSWYDGFAYSIGGAYNGQVPIVLQLVNGRYVDRTLHHRKVTDRIWRSINMGADPHAQWEFGEPVEPGIPSYGERLAILDAWVYQWLQTGRTNTSSISARCSDTGKAWLEANVAKMRDCLAYRSKRITYAKPYDKQPFKWAPLQDRYFVLTGF